MRLGNLKEILYSTTGNIQFAILWSQNLGMDIDKGSVDYIVNTYSAHIVKHISADDNYLVITI